MQYLTDVVTFTEVVNFELALFVRQTDSMPTWLGLDPAQVIKMEVGFPNPASLEHAVVFIRANWSGYSKVSLTNLVEGIQSGLDSSWKLIILNTDTLDFDAFVKVYGPFPSSGGWGEAFGSRTDH